MFLATADQRKTANCRAVERSVQINGKDRPRYQLIARATYLPKGYLVAAATYLRFATVRRLGCADTQYARSRDKMWAYFGKSKRRRGK